MTAPAAAISGPPRPSTITDGSICLSERMSCAACRSPLTSATVMNTRRGRVASATDELCSSDRGFDIGAVVQRGARDVSRSDEWLHGGVRLRLTLPLDHSITQLLRGRRRVL